MVIAEEAPPTFTFFAICCYVSTTFWTFRKWRVKHERGKQSYSKVNQVEPWLVRVICSYSSSSMVKQYSLYILQVCDNSLSFTELGRRYRSIDRYLASENVNNMAAHAWPTHTVAWHLLIGCSKVRGVFSLLIIVTIHVRSLLLSSLGKLWTCVITYTHGRIRKHEFSRYLGYGHTGVLFIILFSLNISLAHIQLHLEL